MKNIGISLLLLCATALPLMTNQISSPKRLDRHWTNQKLVHNGRSMYTGMDSLNSSSSSQVVSNLPKFPRHVHHAYGTLQGQSKASSSSLISNFSSSSSSSSSFSKRRNTSEGEPRSIQYDQPHFDLDNKQANFQQGECKYPCPCTPSSAPPVCKAGVNTVMDGCGCCPQCGRQMGDLCNFRDKCDEQKSLFCDFKLDGGFRGYCRARNPRACNISGKTITDGQTYQPNCSLMCTCQDGKYACSSLCPQELRSPSPTYCKDAQLVTIKAQCCKEWVCPNPHNYPSLEDTLSSQYPNEKACNKEVTDWSMCSKSCGPGESLRVSSDNEDCQAVKEKRLCIIRPCENKTMELSMEQSSRKKDFSHNPNKKTDSTFMATTSNNMIINNNNNKKYIKNNLNIKPPARVKCRATIESPSMEKITYEGCESEKEYQLRYCSTCRRCCGPEKTKTIDVKFLCFDNKTFSKPFMFIEKCVCYKTSNCQFS